MALKHRMDGIPELPSGEIEIPVGNVVLKGLLTVPEGAKGLVLFAHGSGSGRKSPRNQYVAECLNEEGLGTLLMDLLTPPEEREDMISRRLRFDIGLLAQRVISVIDWTKGSPLADLKVGLFGASTGAAAALIAAAERPKDVYAVVSRGGRPDLAGSALDRVYAPTLLIVGENDDVVVDLNRSALSKLHGEKRLLIVPGATHLFEEPGTLAEVARLANRWFRYFLLQQESEQFVLDSL